MVVGVNDVAVGGTDVAVGGADVAVGETIAPIRPTVVTVGGTAASVSDGTGVSVGGTVVPVGGTDLSVADGTGVSGCPTVVTVGGTDVSVGKTGVALPFGGLLLGGASCTGEDGGGGADSGAGEVDPSDSSLLLSDELVALAGMICDVSGTGVLEGMGVKVDTGVDVINGFELLPLSVLTGVDVALAVGVAVRLVVAASSSVAVLSRIVVGEVFTATAGFSFTSFPKNRQEMSPPTSSKMTKSRDAARIGEGKATDRFCFDETFWRSTTSCNAVARARAVG